MSSYSNARAEARKANPEVNTTQRSWSNYEGDTPNRSWVGSKAYQDSSRYGFGGSDLGRFRGGNTTQRSRDSNAGRDKVKPGNENQTQSSLPKDSQWKQLQDRAKANKLAPNKESQWEKLRRESALREGMRSMREQSTNPVA